MMKKNEWKVVLILAVIVVCILLFLQCPEDKTKRKTSEDTALSGAEVKKEMAVEAKTQTLYDTLDFAKSDENVLETTKLVQLVSKEAVPKTTGEVKHKTISLLVKKANKPVLKEITQMTVSGQKGEVMAETTKFVEGDNLVEEVRGLSEKVDVLVEKVRILLARVEAILGKVKTDASVENLEFIKAEDKPIPDKGEETVLDEVVTFKYPTHVLAGGISTYKDWTSYGLQGSYAYRINKYFSLGLQGNTFFKDGKHRGDRSLCAGVRANFHIFPLLVENSRFDLYAGGTVGISRDDAVKTFETMGYLGVSYDFFEHWGVFVEAGNIGVFGLRLKF